MQKFHWKTKNVREKLQGRFYVRNVDDGVTKLHGASKV
jgi:hypothetical protein